MASNPEMALPVDLAPLPEGALDDVKTALDLLGEKAEADDLGMLLRW